jgi:hypothetical protein
VLLDELAHTRGGAESAARIEAFGTRIAALVAQLTEREVVERIEARRRT